jgi:superfamily II DNA/RNA helicase
MPTNYTTRLETELEMVDEKRAIVFVNTKRQCDNVYTQLEGMGFRWVLRSYCEAGGVDVKRGERKDRGCSAGAIYIPITNI